MRTTITILFIFIATICNSQVKTTVEVGKIIIRNLGSTTKFDTITRRTVVNSKTDLIIAIPDHVYFVSTSGSDSNTGKSSQSAWKTLSKVGSSTFTAGDVVLFKKGDVWRGETLSINWSGANGNPIVFGAYGTGNKPIFNGAQIITTWSAVVGKPNVWRTLGPMEYVNDAYRTVVVIDDNRFIAVNSLDQLNADLECFVADNTGGTNDSIYVYSIVNPALRVTELSIALFGIRGHAANRNITIKDLDFRYYGYDGIDVRDPQPNGNWIIDNCNFYFNPQAAVQFYDGHENNIVQNCTVSYCGNGLYANDADNNSFIRNTITNTLSYKYAGYYTDGHAIGIWSSKYVLVERNYIAYGNAGLIGVDESSATIRYNEIHTSGIASTGCRAIDVNLTLVGDTTNIYYNLLFGNSPDGICLSLYTTNGKVNVFNNTMIQDNASEATVLMYYANNITFKNNLFYTNKAISIIFNGTPISDNNLWYNENNFMYYLVGVAWETLTAWKKASSQDTHSSFTNPLFVSSTDFRLQAGSPAINAGVDVGLTRDILGNPIVGNPDIGAYEKQ